jgi:hypothetical protein
LSTLIVRCPLKPFNGNTSGASGDWQDESCLESFEWYLLDGSVQNESDSIREFGIGSTQSMPYADEVLAIMPTLDVRMIEAKVPLVNSKKLQQILPTIIEEYVLGSVESISVQALPPTPHTSPLQRTLVLIDRHWFSWLSTQLEGLLSPRVRLIPDCLLLGLPNNPAGDHSIGFLKLVDNVIYIQRTGEQLGVSWVEHLGQDNIPPSLIASQGMSEISWEWLIPQAKSFLKQMSNSRSINFSLNLLPLNFKSKPTGSYLSGFNTLLTGNKASAGIALANLGWFDPLVWKKTLYWLQLSFFSVLIGYSAHLGWQIVDNWRWTKQMELTAIRSLSPVTVSALIQADKNDVSSLSGNAVLTAFVQQATQNQRALGAVTDADFAPMANKLQMLKQAFGKDALREINYDGYGVSFEVKPGTTKAQQQILVSKAREMGIALKIVSLNRYRIEPYAGIGAGL